MTKDLNDDQIRRYLRFSVLGATAFTQNSYDTQLSIERGVIWLIHQIECWTITARELPAASATEYWTGQITRESKAALIGFSDTDLVDMFDERIVRSAAIGTDAGPAWAFISGPLIHMFNPPIPYAASNIYVAAQSTFGSGVDFLGRIAYTLITVSDKFFYRVATALIA